MRLTETAHAKVNLYLHVTGKRDDGYHLLDSLAVFPEIGDELHIETAETLSLAIGGEFGAALRGEADNLVLRAARALAEATGTQPAARMELIKILPVASGIGGGSADAAAALRGLARLWGAKPASIPLAAKLGADVPVCLAARAARMQGIGEILSPPPGMPECGMVLINPGVAVSTPAVFRARQGGFSAPATLPPAWPDFPAMAVALGQFSNDLEAPATALQPVIGEVLTALRTQPGCALARMSGSGATCFGLFAQASAAHSASQALGRPGWWVWGGALPRVAEES